MSIVCYIQVNLLVAIPMAVVDLGVSIAVTLAGLAWLLIGPVMDIVQVTNTDTLDTMNDTYTRNIYISNVCCVCAMLCECCLCVTCVCSSWPGSK